MYVNSYLMIIDNFYACFASAREIDQLENLLIKNLLMVHTKSS